MKGLTGMTMLVDLQHRKEDNMKKVLGLLIVGSFLLLAAPSNAHAGFDFSTVVDKAKGVLSYATEPVNCVGRWIGEVTQATVEFGKCVWLNVTEPLVTVETNEEIIDDVIT